MADWNHCARERALLAEDDITVVFHRADGHGASRDNECGDDELTAERVHLQPRGCRVSCAYDGGDDAEETEEARGSEDSPEGGERRALCPPACCVRGKPASREGREERTYFSLALNKRKL